MTEILFTVENAREGGMIARAVGHSIFTEADDLAELRQKIREAVACHFDPTDRPEWIRLQSACDEDLSGTDASGWETLT